MYAGGGSRERASLWEYQRAGVAGRTTARSRAGVGTKHILSNLVAARFHHAMLHTGLDILLCAETLDQELLQRNGIVVLRIMAAVDQRDSAATCCFQHGKPRSRFFFEFDEVTPTELIPQGGIVIKPFPQVYARGCIFQAQCWDEGTGFCAGIEGMILQSIMG